MEINTNIAALQTSTNLLRVNRKLALAVEKMSSGLKINSVADDPAGLAISNKLRSQIKGLNMASKNALDGVSVMQTANGALDEIGSITQRVRELSVEAANDTNTPDDRAKIQTEVNELVLEIDGIVDKTEFNGKKIFGGEFSRLTVNQQGANSADEIVKTLYTSASAPNGTLQYQIDQFGMPPMVTGTISDQTMFGDTELLINGEKIELSAEDTADDALKKIRDACARSDIEVITPAYPASGDLIFVGKKAGKNTEITFEPPNSQALATLGLTAGTTKGSDPVISGLSFINPDNSVNTDFGAGSTVTYDGNRVLVTGRDGQEIQFELQTETKADGTQQLKNGAALDPDGKPAAAMNMTLELKDFGTLILQTGTEKGMEATVEMQKISAEILQMDDVNCLTKKGAQAGIVLCDAALDRINSLRGTIGAFQNRLEYTTESLNATALNTETAKSRILDTDMAQEMTTYTQLNVISQAGISILAQANQRPQQLLQLLN